MQEYWLCLENGNLEGPYELPALVQMRQTGRLQPNQRLQRVLGGDLVPASAVLPETESLTQAIAGPSPLEQALQLRPLNTAELLDRVFEFYRQHFLQLFLFGCMSYGLLSFATILTGFLPKSGEPAEMLTAIVQNLPLVVVSIVLWITGVVVLLLMQGALTYLIAETYLGRPKSIRQALKVIPATAGPLLLTVLLKLFLLSAAFSLVMIPPVIASVYFFSLTPWQWGLLALGMLVTIIPGLILLVRWFITMPIVMLEGAYGWTSLVRSSRLIGHHSKGGFWQWGETRLSLILLVLLVIGMLLALASYLPHIFNDLLTQQRMQDIADFSLLTSVLDFLTSSLMMPLYSVATTLFYFDLKMRREGYDLELLAEELQQEEPT